MARPTPSFPMRPAGWALKTLVILWAITGPAPLWAEYPQIRSLGPQDPLFRQLTRQIELYHQRLALGETAPDLSFFQYSAKSEDTLFTIAARVNLPYEAISTLNRIDKAQDLGPGRRILIPSQPGLFLESAQDEDGLGTVMASWRSAPQESASLKIERNGHLTEVLFFPGARFHPIERAFFLGILFRFPLPKGRLTSSFGQRINPFTGHPSFHNGIDIGAPEGTEVFAAREGTVMEAGQDRVYGRFVRIAHPGGYETLYGHLSKVEISLNDQIVSGRIIGRVGTTGMSTGPHLHFEIRRAGHAQDPVPLLPGKN